MNVTTRISGIGAYKPTRVVTNDDVLAMLKRFSEPYLNEESLTAMLADAREKLERAGNQVRNWCRPDEYCADIAYEASRVALADAGLDAEELDMIIFTGMSKAFVEPATGHVLRAKLKALNANVIDTQDACTSFMKSIELANGLIQSGRYNRILIAAGERSFDWADFTCKTVDELKWKFGSLTIGDAAGAMVLEATTEPEYIDETRHMRFFYHLADGAYGTCTIGLNHITGERYKLFSHSKRLISTGYEMTSSVLKDVFSQDEWKDFHCDVLFYHDVGKVVEGLIYKIIEENHIPVPEQRNSFFSDYGNVGSVSLPLSMWRVKTNGGLKRGDRCMYICPAAGVQCGVMMYTY